jgi:hypothetical protein
LLSPRAFSAHPFVPRCVRLLISAKGMGILRHRGSERASCAGLAVAPWGPQAQVAPFQHCARRRRPAGAQHWSNPNGGICMVRQRLLGVLRLSSSLHFATRSSAVATLTAPASYSLTLRGSNRSPRMCTWRLPVLRSLRRRQVPNVRRARRADALCQRERRHCRSRSSPRHGFSSAECARGLGAGCQQDRCLAALPTSWYFARNMRHLMDNADAEDTG